MIAATAAIIYINLKIVAFVNLTIAIVVQAIANFKFGTCLSLTLGLTAAANRGTGGTLTCTGKTAVAVVYTTGACITFFSTCIFVGLAVTIVVNPIAGAVIAAGNYALTAIARSSVCISIAGLATA